MNAATISKYLLAGLAVISAAVAAQQYPVPEPQQFDTTQVCLADIAEPITVELAETEEQHARGLMERESLQDYHGMWFKYPSDRPGYAGFWMFHTLIPLDIAYLDSDGKIVAAFTMLPCKSDDPRQCRAYNPNKTYRSAIELPAGFLSRHDIRMGDRLRQSSDGSCATSSQ
ncbi:hypothetical protein CWI84_00095 [Idiomarina tyrosinivorans]|uniref:DUF192 domain-containing protein n=1 Tax=Idiomarina tyrosinivorans TaxID=1445662 RepID=A0A432ZTU5_9GAMM|nr:DUF192 domain-containing protein [Idiomarina tyrosinivorans]RUO81206.1 hypothetical protein CWI84_00095 [Idiomarina tyrosinivorans]